MAIWRFGPFSADPDERKVTRSGLIVRLTPKEFDILILLLENANSLVTKDTIKARIWPDTHISEAALQRVISDLRKNLFTTEAEQCIETVPKHGYRLRADVEWIPATQPAVPEIKNDTYKVGKVTGIAALLAMIAIVYAVGRFGNSANPQLTGLNGTGFKRIAVMAFSVEGSAGDSAAIGFGIADALQQKLRESPSLTILDANRFQPLKSEDAMAFGKRVRADAVLTGVARFAAGHWLSQTHLFRVADGSQTLARTVSAPNLPELEDKLIAAWTGPPTSASDLFRRRAPNAASHELYVRGRYEWSKRTPDSIANALTLFQRSIDLAPNYARAYAGLADCYLLLGGYGIQPQIQMLSKAKAMSLRAAQLDPMSAESFASLGLITQNLDWDWNQARTYYRQALSVEPEYATGHHWYGEFLSILGEFHEAKSELDRARQLDPTTPMIAADAALIHIYEHDWKAARKILHALIEQEPDFFEARERLAWIDMLEDREQDAWRQVQSIPDCRIREAACNVRWTAWLTKRDPSAAGSALQKLESNPATPHYALLVAYARHRKQDQALTVLESMVDQHSIWLITAKVNPLFDSLRQYSRMKKVLDRLHLN